MLMLCFAFKASDLEVHRRWIWFSSHYFVSFAVKFTHCMKSLLKYPSNENNTIEMRRYIGIVLSHSDSTFNSKLIRLKWERTHTRSCVKLFDFSITPTFAAFNGNVLNHSHRFHLKTTKIRCLDQDVYMCRTWTKAASKLMNTSIEIGWCQCEAKSHSHSMNWPFQLSLNQRGVPN